MDILDHNPYQQYEIKEGIVFLIELSPAIYTPIHQLDEQSQIVEILSCINDLLSEMVMTFPNNGVGIYLYNCTVTGSKYAKNSGINKVFSLNDLNSSNMKSLINILHDDIEASRPLRARFPPVQEPSDNLHTVLKTVLREFQKKPQYNRKKLFWFTNNDRPTSSSTQTTYVPPPSSEDVVDGFGHTKDKFSWSKTTVSSQIRESIFRLKEVKRVQFTCNLILSDGPGIGGRFGCSIKGYTLYNHEQIRPFKKVDTESGEIRIVHNDTKAVNTASLEEIRPENPQEKYPIYKGVPVKSGADGEKVLLIKPDVMDFMRSYSFDHIPKAYEDKDSLGPESQKNGAGLDDDDDMEGQIEFSNAPYLKLLCFRKMSKFVPYFNMKPPRFVAADLNDGMNGSNTEGGYSNSFDTFRALYQSCVRLKKYAVVFGCTKTNSTPSLYALYPTNCSNPQTNGPGALKKTPDGFLLIRLPWLTELRSLPDYMLAENDGMFVPCNEKIKPQELVTLYGKLIDHFEHWSVYDPSAFNNPTLHYFYKTIKHEALQLDVEDEDTSLAANDWSVRKLLELRKMIDSDAGIQQLLKFLNKILTEVNVQESSKRGAKEKDEVSTKRPRSGGLTEGEVIAHWKSNTWTKVTVPQLRDFMKRYNIKSDTKKVDMVIKTIEFLKSRSSEPQT
ncbi:hypothetical protein JCM33374_g4697 [Metschnikowia sp. JCM 33374]|nr:hypothetical protein JCM33374_g4697 [Metschnikowia sp. JCM 33374]